MDEVRNPIDILETCLADRAHGATMVYSIMTRIEKAVELLKEQQPRVLTLLEVINHFSIPYDISKDIGKEFDYQQEIEPLYFDFPMDDIDPYIVHWRGYSQVIKYLDVWKNDYGKSWRVWSAKPTKEQRKAVPWETH